MKRRFCAGFVLLLVFCGFVSSGVAAESSNVPQITPSQLQELQGRMLGDEGVMALIQGMQSDPEIQALLNDPKVLEAVQSGDTAALLRDPRFMKLLENQQVKEIGKRLGVQE